MTPLWLTNLARRVRALFPGGIPTGFPEEWQTLPALRVDDEGWLVGEGVTRIPMHPSWRYSSLLTPGSRPQAVVWHYSATDAGTAVSMAKRRTRAFGSDLDDRVASWHISVETYGGIVQMAPLTVGTWHAGSPTAVKIKGLDAWANRCSVGIELIGHGKAFPQAQVIDAARVLAAIVDAYGIDRRYASVTHAELDPGRRSDPGPVWRDNHRAHVEEYAYARSAVAP